MTGPRILIVNDDGIEAQGLAELETIAREFTNEVWVVAPDGERSGASHAISLSTPTRVRQIGERRFAVQGTPADCVILAVWELLAENAPDLVLSGINHGENLGDDMLYSGTTGAAMEAAILGIPCVAFSQVRRNFGTAHFGLARRYAPAILQRLFEAGLEKSLLLNVNFPDGEEADATGVVVAPTGRRGRGTFTPISGRDGRNAPFYWTRVRYDPQVTEDGTDLAGIRDGCITITPLTVDLTDQRRLREASELFAELVGTKG
jgi:5'-nucleotidase